MELQKNIKLKLLGYLLISMLGFSYLVFIRNAGISIPIFFIIQFVCLSFLMPNKKPLLLFIPIIILSLNSFISANTMWRVPNFFVIVALFSVMSLWAINEFSIAGKLVDFISKTVKNSFKPFRYFWVAEQWCRELLKEKKASSTSLITAEQKTIIKRILAGIGISIPLLFLILTMLSSADEIFARSLSAFLDQIADIFSIDLHISDFITFRSSFRLLKSVLSGLYLFGILYFIYTSKNQTNHAVVAIYKKPITGDLIIINIVLVSILIIYTLFVAIQFRYLFASSGNLPYGLNYVEYARRGFFELLFLSFVNITIILIVVWLTKNQQHVGTKISQVLCGYLCAVTMVLLVSSFYRMSLYSSEYGLTRLRFLVFGFLIFEAIGLIFTMFYIIKPKFNILAVYTAIGLTYYLLLNVVPMDAIIARNQIDRYFATGGNGVFYALTLSADAAQQVSRLHESDDQNIHWHVWDYFDRIDLDDAGWRQWNLSTARAQNYR